MKKILVIEDEPEMRRNLTTILLLEKFRPLVRREWSSRRRVGEEGNARLDPLRCDDAGTGRLRRARCTPC